MDKELIERIFKATGMPTVSVEENMHIWMDVAHRIAEECAKVAETTPVEFFCSGPGEAQMVAHRAATAAAIREKFKP